jgi:hypothetical protein
MVRLRSTPINKSPEELKPSSLPASPISEDPLAAPPEESPLEERAGKAINIDDVVLKSGGISCVVAV